MSIETPQRRKLFVSLRLKILIAFTILFTVIFIGTYYWFFVYSSERAENRIREDLMSTMVAAAAEINGDEIVALYREGVPREDGFTDDPRYWENVTWLDTVHEIEPRAWLGTYVRDGDDFYFVTDLWALYDPESAANFQQWCDPNPEVCGADAPFEQWTSIQALTQEEPILHPTIISDQWGTWLSGFAPLKNADGETVAGMFVDFEADYVDEVEQGIRDSILLAFVITYGVFFIFIYIIASLGSRPILKFTRAAEAVGEGDYEQDFSNLTTTRFPDEISILAGVLSIMIDKVSQREQSLKQRVAALRIEIDEAKRQKEVKKIVESDAFRELREKAQEMRRRRNAGTSGEGAETSENAD
jgi:hypothetical protein